MKRLVSSCFLLLILVACDSDIKTEPAGKPLDREDAQRESRGKLTGPGGLFEFGGGDKESSSGGVIGVNSYLWRATLDTISFMPLTSADPFGGTIITDWYEDPKTPGERFKVTAIILDKTLRADGVRIQLFKQKLTKGSWRDQAVDDKLARALEDTILTRARELKIAAGNK
ncbi:MAG: DUF3576 domain-containing protein [Alphaproteobacteria bacterium]|nr:DUF3576 domain-containing protein [Alphaproteobacteria bacterium]